MLQWFLSRIGRWVRFGNAHEDIIDGPKITIRALFAWNGFTQMNKWEYFTDTETEGMNDDFMVKLVAARKKTIELDPLRKGVPFRGTSWRRSLDKNQSVIGAVPDSAHLSGLAVDLRVYSSQEAGMVIEALILSGINRIGIYVDANWQTVHIHCDGDLSKVHPDVFLKREAN